MGCPYSKIGNQTGRQRDARLPGEITKSVPPCPGVFRFSGPGPQGPTGHPHSFLRGFTGRLGYAPENRNSNFENQISGIVEWVC